VASTRQEPSCLRVFALGNAATLAKKTNQASAAASLIEPGLPENRNAMSQCNIGKATINPIFDGLYIPFMVILGMVYCCFNHILVLRILGYPKRSSFIILIP